MPLPRGSHEWVCQLKLPPCSGALAPTLATTLSDDAQLTATRSSRPPVGEAPGKSSGQAIAPAGTRSCAPSRASPSPRSPPCRRRWHDHTRVARGSHESWPRWMRASKSSTEPERSSGTRSNVHTTHSRSAPSTAASSPRMRPLRHPAGEPRVQSRWHEVKDATSMLARVGDLLAEQAHRLASQNARRQDREHLSPAAGTGRTEPRPRPRPRSRT
jgi:hypothetical protein